MVDRVHLTADERDMLATIAGGMRVRADQWVTARIALARSLQISEAPDRNAFQPLSQQKKGTELHAAQLTGEGREGDEDLTDVLRALISVYEGRDLFADEGAFHEALQRHVRRGLRDVTTSWRPDTDFNRFLAQEVLYDSVGTSAEANEAGDAELAERVIRILGQLGIGGEVVAEAHGPRLSQLTLELNELDDLDRLRRGLGKIAFALGQGQDTVASSLTTGERRVNLLIPRPPANWRTVTWSELRPVLDGPEAQELSLPVCLGTDILGEPFLIDLAEAPHLFIGGTTGSGKSMCLHAILLSLIEGSRDAVQLVLIDPKAVEFSAYDGLSLVRDGVITSPEGALAALEQLVEVMDERQTLFRSLEARNLTEANERGAKLPRIVVVVDELGDLFIARRDVELPLIRLAQKARSAGIHLVLATQRPEAATFPGLLRSNIPSRIALTVQKASESRIILDETGAETLLMRGDMLVRFAGKPTVRAHGCRVEPSDILRGLAST